MAIENMGALQRARRFFTISTDAVQFWILQSNCLDTLHSIEIYGKLALHCSAKLNSKVQAVPTGLREAGLCQQCSEANVLAVCPSHASCSMLDVKWYIHIRSRQWMADKSDNFVQRKNAP